ncbi:xanthine dehydrogenase family protein molybdopterin-binding subunit [Weizmannia acidilactici]|uniref:xanthine dehydrogenase family protein molybdopterin-binding subunit n=1 Tax=Weizmannia acidilactici TaxID=2607726 RepID=UPI001285963E|nr:xanthine dehydrogenase family protein molybdopterin-binding subunit [Weizmannia acidilactici]GER72312.1 xanthine dehydrogenase, molybdenum binding subunit [Weizmannia acidilactici]
MTLLGKSMIRKDALEKVTGEAKYIHDQSYNGLHAATVISPFGHAKIRKIDMKEAKKIPGVRAIITGEGLPLTGEEIRDRPPIAFDKVRHCGEVVAIVVADNLLIAKKAANLIKIAYQPLPVVHSPTEALRQDAPLVHEKLGSYEKSHMVYPIPGTNIANLQKIRKGNMEKGWRESEVIVEASFSIKPSDHAAMETRCSTVEIKSDGTVIISTTSQSPFMVKKLIGRYFHENPGKIIVNTPLVGGAYGGKASVHTELLAYLASKAVGGKPVKLFYSREEDMVSAPGHIGLDAKVKLGATRDGKLTAAEMTFLFDGGAYADKSIDLSRAAAVDCTGPYNIENIRCNSYCMYTNHPYPAPFRGFSHSELLFAFERTMDILVQKLQMDPFDLRYLNAILPGHTTPTQVQLNESTVGNLRKCIGRVKELANWEEGQITEIDERYVRVKGASCGWKTSTIDSNASSGVVLTFNSDGSVNIISGVIEIGTATKTMLAQMLAERFQMDIHQIHVRMKVDTQTTPEHWKTVASRGTFMAGRALMEAADDAERQMKEITSAVLRCTPEDLAVADSRVFQRSNPRTGLHFKDIVYGYVYPNGNAIGGQIIGRGNYILRGMTYLDRETGRGRPGPEWTVCASVVEVEFDRRDYTYKIIKACTVVDIGKVLNEKTAKGQVMGAMSMGLAYGGRETFIFDSFGRVLNPQLRTYRPIYYGENPEYLVDFIETPHLEAPYGLRGVGEHGILGMPAALGNALSRAAGVSLYSLPLTPEYIWRAKEEAANDTI